MSAREDTLSQIRQAGGGRRGKPNHFVNLPDSLLWEVYLRLRQGHSATSIASFLHDNNAAPGNSLDSTAKLLLRFKKKISHLLIGSPLDTSTSAIAKSSLPSVREVSQLVSNGSLKELLQLRDLSRENLHRMLMEEARTGISDKSIAQRQTSLAALEKAVMKLEEGECKNPPAYVPTSDRQAKFARILEGINDPQAVRKAMDGFLEDMSKEVVTLAINADGTYGVAPRTDAERTRALSFGECGGLGIIRRKAEKGQEGGSDLDLE